MSDCRHASIAGPLLAVLCAAVALSTPALAGAKKNSAPAGDDLTALILQLERQDSLTTGSIARKPAPTRRAENAQLSFGKVDDGLDRSYSIVDPSQRSDTLPALGLNLKMDF